MARWLQKLQQYEFTVLHRRGRLYGNADTLSRRPCEETGCKYCERREILEATANEHSLNDGTPSSCGEHIVLTVSSGTTDQPNVVTRIVEAQKQNTEIRIILQWMEESNDKPPWQEVASYNVAVKTHWGQWESLKIHDGKLYKCFHSGKSV